MKHKLLSLIVIAAGMSVVACSDDKGPQVGAQGQILCGTQACSMQKAALAQVPGSQENSLLAKLGITPRGAPGPNVDPLKQVPGATDPNKGSKGFPLASVSDKQIKQQAAKVFAALEADKHNPDSPYYVPPVDETAVAQTEAARSPSSIQAASVSEVQLGVPMIEDGGEAAH